MGKEINQEKTSGKQVIRNEKGQIIQGTANPNGRPPGTLNFATKFRLFIDKIAEKNGMTSEEVEEQLMAVAIKKAKDGDFRFYKDIFDRVYGQPKQSIDFGVEESINKIIVEIVNGDKNQSKSSISEDSPEQI